MVLVEIMGYLALQLANGPSIAITAISVANPTIVTAPAHGLTSGASVAIAGSNSTPSLNGPQTVTVVDANNFSVPVNVTIAGTTGSLQAGCGTPSVDLWEAELPDMPVSPDLAAVINEYGGRPSEDAFGTADIYREWPRVQCVTRGNVRDSVSGRTRAETLYRAFGKIPLPVAIGGTQYYLRKMLQPVFWLKRDDKLRHYHAFNVEFYKDPSAS